MSVMDGSVFEEVLEKLNKKDEKVEKLCEAITAYSIQQPAQDCSISLPIFTYTQIKESLSRRLKEFNAFNEKKEQLDRICRHLQEVNIQG